jgi:hypothetical protein
VCAEPDCINTKEEKQHDCSSDEPDNTPTRKAHKHSRENDSNNSAED